MQESILLQKKKQSIKQKLALHALQKQMQILKLKEYLILTSFVVGGALLRIPMQAVPSAEPLTFFALLSGWLFGKKKGFMVGAASLYLSNFMMFGGHGIWTIPQLVAFGAAGYIGGFLRKKASVVECIGYGVLATIVFEVVMNFGTPWMYAGGILISLFAAIPFMLTHLLSNSLFAIFLPWSKRFVEKKAGFDERELCNKLLKKFKRG